MTDQLKVTEPMDDWVERVIDRALAKHTDSCPVRRRVELVELRFAYLIGYMVGSGLLGGTAGALVAKLVTGA